MTLNELKNAITSIYPTAKAGVDYSLATDSSGASTIALWNNALGAQPTDSQLATAAAAYDLGVAKGSQLAILGAAFNAAYGANITYNGATFPTTPDVQQLLVFAQSAGIAKGNTLPSEFACKDIHGVPVPMTFAQLQGLMSAIFDQSYAAFVKFSQLQAQVAAATTIPAVQAVVWS